MSKKKRSPRKLRKLALYTNLLVMAKTSADKELIKKYEDMSLPELEELLEEVDGDFAEAQTQDENPALIKQMIKYKKQ